ncbi:MAG: CBS domain-containing protein [Planctomycetaceae bacterium]|nr:CBS domain-containing protein [Planctomycetaceae bacterium]
MSWLSHVSCPALATVFPSQSLAEAEVVMLRRGEPEVLVISPEGELQGQITDYDLIKARLLGPIVQETVGRWMAGCPAIVSATATSGDVLRLFRESRHRRLAVVEGRRLVGIISRLETLRWLSRETATSSSETAATRAPHFGLAPAHADWAFTR